MDVVRVAERELVEALPAEGIWLQRVAEELRV